MQEKQKELEECKGYFISNFGNIYNVSGKLLKPYVTKSGRRKITLFNNGNPVSIKICISVAKYFLRNPNNKLHVVHIDGDMWNDNVSNLKYSYQPEFSIDAMDNRKNLYGMRLGKKHWKSRPFTVNGKKFYTLREAGENLKTPIPTIQKRLENPNMKNYKHV